ncbi:hypothetical protein SLEP1_g11112 [Rubroshorea leprosula]|uniref:Uncharacterized protein n=1 Tax=Rubroshorea leprosula TaxID=152421 RepID=A0AAV5IG24_9ROSI|nr:hypothetical protein SLEP1_g11112 [Rubroshorea leprosula]
MSLFESNLFTIRIIFFTTVFILLCPALARNPHIINFRSPNLYPEGLAWDPSAQHFLVGSLHHRTINSISDAGVRRAKPTRDLVAAYCIISLRDTVTVFGACSICTCSLFTCKRCRKMCFRKCFHRTNLNPRYIISVR